VTVTPTLPEAIDAAISALETYGHGHGANLNNETGTLCLNGALLIGTRCRSREAVNGRFCFSSTREDVVTFVPRRAYRDALWAVYPLIPVVAACCAEERVDPMRAITHWNDFHCQGGEDAILILKTAREEYDNDHDHDR
jgi:hypothetical protein